MKRLCIYHDDSDGKMSAAIYKEYIIKNNNVNGCEFIEASHHNKDNLKEQIVEIILKNANTINEIVILDFSFDYEFMCYLKDSCDDFIWIDHHITAKESCHDLWDSCSGLRDIKLSGAELTWKVFGNEENPHYKVDLVGDYDLWNFKFGDATRYFAEINRYYDVKEFQKILNNHKFFESEMKKGIILYKDKLRKVTEKINGKYIKKIKFEGYNCGLMNNSEYYDASHIGNEICNNGYDISLTFVIKEDNVIFSLRCIKEDIDVSKIAERYGGGGHRKASGFILTLKEGLDLIKKLYIGGY